MPAVIRKSSTAGTLSMTPLIDVVFLLLIFFLVASRFEQEERDLAVNLPKASEAQPTVFAGKEVYVTITADGKYFVDGQQYTSRSLEEKLRALYQNNPGRQRVKIRADEKSQSGALVGVMNACNRANIGDYTIATE
jgi:biopolymer transport protein ExbD